MKIDEETSFHWSNYLKPTPRNLQYFVGAIKGIIVVGAGSSMVAGNATLAFYIMLIGAVLEEMSKFFGRVAEDYEREIKITKTETTTITDTVKEVNEK